MLNKETYNKLSKVPAEMTKKITGGRLNGLTDIKPQWRYQVLTEVFGLCGFGWKFTIDKLWTENGSGGQIFAFANITLFVKDGDKWSDGITGNGGSMLVVSESKGLHNSDEGFKMAITDALSTACKMIGVGADIYMGLPASKYNVEPPKTETKLKEQPKEEPKEKPAKSILDENIEAAMKVAGMDKKTMLNIVKNHFAKKYNDLTSVEKTSLINVIKLQAETPAEEVKNEVQ
jgi:hypothetical protein